MGGLFLVAVILAGVGLLEGSRLRRASLHRDFAVLWLTLGLSLALYAIQRDGSVYGNPGAWIDALFAWMLPIL